MLTVGSLSKLFWGGLRVGWIRGPESMITRLSRLKAVIDLSGSLVSQAVATACARATRRTWRRCAGGNARVPRSRHAAARPASSGVDVPPPGGRAVAAGCCSPGMRRELGALALRRGVAISAGHRLLARRTRLRSRAPPARDGSGRDGGGDAADRRGVGRVRARASSPPPCGRRAVLAMTPGGANDRPPAWARARHAPRRTALHRGRDRLRALRADGMVDGAAAPRLGAAEMGRASR